jgi:hypothetical protein
MRNEAWTCEISSCQSPLYWYNVDYCDKCSKKKKIKVKLFFRTMKYYTYEKWVYVS